MAGSFPRERGAALLFPRPEGGVNPGKIGTDCRRRERGMSVRGKLPGGSADYFCLIRRKSTYGSKEGTSVQPFPGKRGEVL